MDGHIKIFSNQNYQLLHTIEGHAMPIRSITFSPDSQFMMSASDDGHIKGKMAFILGVTRKLLGNHKADLQQILGLLFEP